MTALIIGEALLDVTHERGRSLAVPGGSPANVALGLGRLGRSPLLHTSIGDDDAGLRIRAHLETSGVAVTPTSIGTASTSLAHARLADDGDARYDFEISWDPAAPPVENAELVHVGSIGSWLLPGSATVAAALADARERGAVITYDPNIRLSIAADEETRRRILRSVAASDLVKLSDEDAAWLFPGLDPDAVLDEILSRGPRLAALTLGGDGGMLASPTHRVTRPAVAARVVDTIGAGDTFMTMLVDALISSPGLLAGGDPAALGRTLERALRGAAITVSRAGADLPWLAELPR